MIEWLLPALGFVLVEGAIGITTKLALRDWGWTQLILWATVAYALIATWLLAVSGHAFPLGAGAGWAALSGVFAAAGLVSLFLALEGGEASKVVPVTAAYPVASAIFAAMFLAEQITLLRALGTALVTVGVIVLSRE